MSCAEMHNLWIQTEAPFATWIVDLEPIREQSAALLGVVEKILVLGAEHRVFELVSAHAISFERSAESINTRLRQIYKEQGRVNLFGFTGAAMAPGAGSSTAEAWLAWYDAEDKLVEGPCSDLGELLSQLEPVPDSIPQGFMQRYPPVRITGPRTPNRPLQIAIEIHSDIWFPWIFGSAHPAADYQRLFDNRELAARHTPRLNQFLAGVTSAVTTAGGTFDLDKERTGAQAAEWISREGVRLDRSAPNATMPASMLDIEWF